MELEVRGIFLNISKAFDKVWHDGLIFKLRQNGICGEMINILEDFLSDRKQRVFLNIQYSPQVDIRASVSQESISRRLFHLISINNLLNYIKRKCELFADDTSLSSVHDIGTSANQWELKFNPDPTKQAQEIIFSKKKTVSKKTVFKKTFSTQVSILITLR